MIRGKEKNRPKIYHFFLAFRDRAVLVGFDQLLCIPAATCA
jgi:hypothetical protein